LTVFESYCKTKADTPRRIARQQLQELRWTFMDIRQTALFKRAYCIQRSNLISTLVLVTVSFVSVSSAVGQQWGQPPRPDDQNLSERFVHSISVLIRQIEQQYDPPINLNPVEEHVQAAVEHFNSLHREWRLIRQYELKRNARLSVDHPQLASPDRGVYGGRYFPPAGDR
jgi:hypothetical protein